MTGGAGAARRMGYWTPMSVTSHLAERLARREHGRPGIRGAGRVLVVAYAILAIAATGRSAVQILGHFSTAPLAYALSAFAAAVYVAATVGLVSRAGWARPLAWGAIAIEFAGVVAVGLLSALEPQLFPADTVWSGFGRGYLWVPAVLPLLGMAWLEGSRPDREGRRA